MLDATLSNRGCPARDACGHRKRRVAFHGAPTSA